MRLSQANQSECDDGRTAIPTLGVLLPTRNSIALLREHLESMRPWLDLASEVVVVDSESTDGTVELLREKLAHPNARFFNHPPGLYQSWNFGIRNITAKYVYISTVGDSITRSGVKCLLDAAERFQSDVVISKPGVITESGQPLPDGHWPIHDILERLPFAQSAALSTGQQFIFALTNIGGALLGSSASNLYRAACLRARPFPVEFGTAGDGGWSFKYIFDIRVAVARGQFSTFRIHEKSYSMSEYPAESLALRFFRLAQEAARERQARDPLVAALLREICWPELEQALQAASIEHDRLERCRRGFFPWYFQPRAWQARARRNRAESLTRRIKDGLIAGVIGKCSA